MNGPAYQIALTIVSTKLDVNDLEEAAFETLKKLADIHGWDEQFAGELYGRLIDTFPLDVNNDPTLPPFDELVKLVGAAFNRTQSFRG